MFIRITRGTYETAREGEIQRTAEEQIVPHLRRLPGFGGCYGGFDRRNGRLASVTLWERADQANGVREAIGDPVLHDIADAGAHLEPAEVYEVTVVA